MRGGVLQINRGHADLHRSFQHSICPLPPLATPIAHRCNVLVATMSIYSIHGKGLKLDTRADIEPYLREINPEVLEEIHLGGNTIGIEAAQALAEVLQKASKLRVRLLHFSSNKRTPNVYLGGRLRRYLHWTVDQRNPASHLRPLRRSHRQGAPHRD